MRILVTGATGLIGSRVLEPLVMRGDTVSVLAQPPTIAQLRHQDHIRVVPGDLLDQSAVDHAVRDTELVIHLAGALPGNSDQQLARVNVQGTDNLVRSCIRSGVRRVVYASTTAVYGHVPPRHWPINESFPRSATGAAAILPYASSKIGAEDLIVTANGKYGIEYTILRPHIVYGPGSQITTMLVNQAMAFPRISLRDSRRAAIVQWIHVDDVVRAILLSVDSPHSRNAVYNIAGLQIVTMHEFAKIVWGSKYRGIALPDSSRAPSSIPAIGMKYDVSRARAILGFAPTIELAEGLHQFLVDLET